MANIKEKDLPLGSIDETTYIRTVTSNGASERAPATDLMSDFASLFGQTLWTGSWSSGSITVPDTDKYKIFIIMQGGQSVLVIKRSTNLYVDGFTLIGSSSGTQYVKSFSAAINNNTWTYRWANEIAHNVSSNHGAARNGEVITEIIGLVPIIN